MLTGTMIDSVLNIIERVLEIATEMEHIIQIMAATLFFIAGLAELPINWNTLSLTGTVFTRNMILILIALGLVHPASQLLLWCSDVTSMFGTKLSDEIENLLFENE